MTGCMSWSTENLAITALRDEVGVEQWYGGRLNSLRDRAHLLARLFGAAQGPPAGRPP